jgi:hypothetical protein
VISVAAVIVVASISVYVLTRRPLIPLTVSDGSTREVLKAAFANYTHSDHPIFRIYTATTYANESGGVTSTLTLRLYMGVFYDPYGAVMFDLFPVVSGTFAPNLSPTGVTLAFNQTGRYAWAFGYGYPVAFNNSFPPAPIAFPGPTNVTFNPSSMPQVAGTGSTSMGATLVNQSATGPSYRFFYPTYILEQDPLGDNVFFAIRITVTGPFTPAVSVTIAVATFNEPA